MTRDRIRHLTALRQQHLNRRLIHTGHISRTLSQMTAHTQTQRNQKTQSVTLSRSLMYLGATRTRPIVEGVLGDLPFVCSNIRFAHYVLAARTSMLAACPPLPVFIGAAGLAQARSWPPGAVAGRQGMN